MIFYLSKNDWDKGVGLSQFLWDKGVGLSNGKWDKPKNAPFRWCLALSNGKWDKGVGLSQFLWDKGVGLSNGKWDKDFSNKNISWKNYLVSSLYTNIKTYINLPSSLLSESTW